MGTKCPKCDTNNPSDSKFCKECATPLPVSEEISVTKTLEAIKEELTTGSTLAGRYQIIEELGKGGMGKVYKVLDNEINEEVALKLLKPEIAQDKKTIERFRNELRFARKISHKNVCRMYHLAKEEETPYITMEYVEGEDLKNLTRRRGRLLEEDAISIAKQLCEGLAEAHRLGVVHRDLKPQNIMIDKEGNAKIMDFGIARSVEVPGITQTGMMIGTPDYISPEQAEGEEADQRSDIYSLGVILYEMLTGRVPFKGDSALSVALKHKTQIPKDPRKLNPEISEHLSRLILICMEKDRNRRYQKVEELLADLRNIEEGFPLGTKIRPKRETFVTALIRKKLFIPTLVVALAIMGVIIWRFLPKKEVIRIAPSDKSSLAVMYFKNNTGDDSLEYLRSALSDLLITDLSQSKHLRVLSEGKLFKILSQLNQLEAQTYSQDVLNDVATQGGVSHLLLGKYAKMGDVFRIDVVIQEATTGEIIGSERVEAIREEEIFPKVDELTRRIKANLKLSEEQIAADMDKEIGKITSSSPEAIKYYIDARKYHNKGDYNQSIQLMKKAVAIDPEFAMAYTGMASSYFNLGYYSEERKFLKKALELMDRVSDRERYSIQGHFYELSEETYDKAIEAYNKLVQFYPEDEAANINLARLSMRLEEWDKAIERFEVLRQGGSKYIFVYSNLAIVYWHKGFYEKAEEVLKDYINNFSDNAIINGILAYNYLFQGEYHRALSEVNKAISLDPTYYRNLYIKGDIYHINGDLIEAEKEYKKLLDIREHASQLHAIDKLAALFLLQGGLRKSEDQLKKGIELAKEIGDEWQELEFHLRLSYRYLKSERLEKALEECNKAWSCAVQAIDQSSQRSVLHFKGLIYLEMKLLDEAQKAADELKELSQKGLNRKIMRDYYHLMGMKKLEKNNFSMAIKNFEKAISMSSLQFSISALFIDSLALAYWKAGDLEEAREEYERIMALTYGRLYYGDIYAKSFYMLGKIYEEQGDATKAIEHYEKFLDFWKDADPGIAEVEDARKRLAGLEKKT